MERRKGFTLIEVILSLAILGIISIAFLGAMANHFTFLAQTKEITEDVFLVQRKMEEEIDLVKQEITDLKSGLPIPSPRTLKQKTIFISDLDGGIEVSYYEIQESLNNKEYFTLVSNVKPDPLALLSLESVSSKLKYSATNVKYGYSKTPEFKIEGNFKNLNTDKYDHLLNQVEWYASNKKYNMPIPKNLDMNANLEYNSYYFPLFPRDYELIDNETVFRFGSNSNTFNKLSEFRGRHILYTVTPAAKSGKLGKQSISETGPIFISGLPVFENLIMHFDASYIDVTNSTEVNAGSYMNKWIDISSVIRNSISEESASSSSKKPMVKRTDMGVGFIGQYVSFTDDQELSITKVPIDLLTILSVVKNSSISDETEYLTNGDIALRLDPSSEDNWRVEYDVVSTKDPEYIIGGKNVDIAEMIVYHGRLDITKRDKLEKYISEKYIDSTFTGDIVNIENTNIEIKIGEGLPNMVRAEMQSGVSKYVCVKWLNPESLDINNEGTYTIRGKTLADPEMTMAYTITVVAEETP